MIKEILLIGGSLVGLWGGKTGSAKMFTGGSNSNARLAVECAVFFDSLIDKHNANLANGYRHDKKWDSPYASGDIGYEDSLYMVLAAWIGAIGMEVDMKGIDYIKGNNDMKRPDAVNMFMPLRKTGDRWYLHCALDNIVYSVESKHKASWASDHKNESEMYEIMPESVKSAFLPVLGKGTYLGRDVFMMNGYSRGSIQSRKEGLKVIDFGEEDDEEGLEFCWSVSPYNGFDESQVGFYNDKPFIVEYTKI